MVISKPKQNLSCHNLMELYWVIT